MKRSLSEFRFLILHEFSCWILEVAELLTFTGEDSKIFFFTWELRACFTIFQSTDKYYLNSESQHKNFFSPQAGEINSIFQESNHFITSLTQLQYTRCWKVCMAFLLFQLVLLLPSHLKKDCYILLTTTSDTIKNSSLHLGETYHFLIA